MTACGIAPEDDDGNSASRQQKPAAQQEAVKPFDLDKALKWVREGADTEQVKRRGRQAFQRATNAEEKARIAALVEEIEQAAMAGV
jgi:hypothetical protein